MESDNAVIEGIGTWELWAALKAENPPFEGELSPEDLAPISDSQRMYLRCLKLAQDRADVADQYFEHEPLSSIYEKHALIALNNHLAAQRMKRSQKQRQQDAASQPEGGGKFTPRKPKPKTPQE